MTASGVARTGRGSAVPRGRRPMPRARGTHGLAALGQRAAALLLAAGLVAAPVAPRESKWWAGPAVAWADSGWITEPVTLSA